MAALSRQAFDASAALRASNDSLYANLDLYVPAYGRSFAVEILLREGSNSVSEQTLLTLGEIVALSSEDRARICELLHEDAMRAREICEYGDPEPPPEVPPAGFLGRLFWRPGRYRFVALAWDDPRHPCHLPGGAPTVEEKVEFLGFRIDEQTQDPRLALLDCRPRWEEEHGACVVLRNGVPIAIDGPDADLSVYQGG